MAGTAKDFLSNVIKQIKSVRKTSVKLSREKEEITATKKHLIAEFNELVKTVRFIDKHTCDEAIANVNYILRAPTRHHPDANKLSAEMKDIMRLLLDIDVIDASAEKKESRFEDSSVVTSNHKSDDLDDENDRSVADKLVQQPSQSLSSMNRVSKVNNGTLAENANLSVIEQLRLRLPKDTDITLCDSNVNSTRMTRDVLFVHEESNMSIIQIKEIPLLQLMEASEVQIAEMLEKEAIVDLDNCMEESPNNVEISRVSSSSNYQTGSILPNNESLDNDLDINTNQTTSDLARHAALTRQKIVPVPPEKTASIRKLGNPRRLQYKPFCDLSSLKPRAELSTSNLHGQNMTPFPPHQFLEVPALPLPPPLPVPTSMPAGKTTSSSAKNMNVHQGPMKLQSVRQPSLQTSVTSGKSALGSQTQILPKVPAGSVEQRAQINMMSSQPALPSKNVSLMMKDGKMRVLRLPQLKIPSIRRAQMMFITDSKVRIKPVRKQVLQSTASRNTSRTIVLPPAQSGN